MASGGVKEELLDGENEESSPSEASSDSSEEETESDEQDSEEDSDESGNKADEIYFPGFNKFKADLGTKLTEHVVRELACYLLDYPQTEATSALNYDDEMVGHAMVSKLEESGDIGPRDIYPLVRALSSLQHVTVAESVKESYDRMVSKTPKFAGKTKMFIEGVKAVYKEMIKSQRTVAFQSVEHNLTDVFIKGSLERLEETKSEIEPEVWTDVETHQELFNDPYNRIVLEGEPGYGKSTMSVQLVHEWCQGEYDADLLIFLRLREVSTLSLYQAIRLFTLPKELPLKEQDIKRILSSSKLKIVFLFDGYEDYTNITPTSDFVAILNSELFPSIRVITTTRAAYMEEILGPGVTRMRFKGFDDRMQKLYMEKVLGSGKTNYINKLMRSFTEKSLLVDLCQVPFFFAHFVHILDRDKDLPDLQTVTAHMKYLVDSCFSAKLNGEDIERVGDDEITNLTRIAYESLKAVHRDYVWNLNAFQKTVGHRCCERFTKAGILYEKRSRIKFVHSIFQEYLAALYMQHLVKSGNQFLLQNSLDAFKPKELKFMFLFGCGMGKDVATTLINFFLSKEGFLITMRFCLLDVRRSVPPLLDAVRAICDMYVSIYIFESRLAQRSTVNVLRIAAKHKIPVFRVWMVESFGTADAATGDVVLRSGVALPRLTMVKQIVIGTERGREFTMDEWIGLLKYAGYSKKIEILDVYWCLLPFTVIPRNIPMSLKSKAVSIKWGTLLVIEHKLDLYTGVWQGKLNGVDMTKEEYEQEVVKFRERFRQEKWKQPLDELSDGFARLALKTDPYS